MSTYYFMTDPNPWKPFFNEKNLRNVSSFSIQHQNVIENPPELCPTNTLSLKSYGKITFCSLLCSVHNFKCHSEYCSAMSYFNFPADKLVGQNGSSVKCPSREFKNRNC